MINYKIGDATFPDEEESVLVHCCNNIGKWGSGFVLAIDEQFGDWIGQSYREQPTYELGSIRKFKNWYTLESKARHVVNLIGQRGVRSPNNPKPIDYGALAIGLARVDQWIVEMVNYGIEPVHAPVVMPRIGAGLAGGRWSVIESIINKTMANRDVYVYDLPGTVPGRDYNP